MSRFLCWVTLPPPHAGPEVASEMLFAELRKVLPDIHVENATLRTTNVAKGRLDLAGIMAFARGYGRFLRGIFVSRCRVVYLILSANPVAFMRDAVLIWTAVVLGKRVVVHLRGGNYDNFYRSSGPRLQWMVRRTWGMAARAIVQGERLRTLLARAAPRVPVEVLPNGLPDDGIRAKDRYPHDGPVTLVFLGHLIFTKGFNDLLQVYRRLKARYPQLRWRFAGERPHRSTMIAQFLEGERREYFLKNVDAIEREAHAFIDQAKDLDAEHLGIVSGDAKWQALTSADVFVLPSYMEGFSFAMLEAMFAGLPVVTTAVGAAPDVIVEGRNGFLLQPGDQPALESALERLIVDPDLRERMGRANAVEARERYSLSVVARRFAGILTDVDR